MKTCDIIFGKYYTAEHNECMELMVRRLSGVQVLMEGATADGERMVVANMDDTAYAILLALSNADCLYVIETEV